MKALASMSPAAAFLLSLSLPEAFADLDIQCHALGGAATHSKEE